MVSHQHRHVLVLVTDLVTAETDFVTAVPALAADFVTAVTAVTAVLWAHND